MPGMHGTGQYTISDLAELFSISRATVYRKLLPSQTILGAIAVIYQQVDAEYSAKHP